jgi:hypothetical protein
MHIPEARRERGGRDEALAAGSVIGRAGRP